MTRRSFPPWPHEGFTICWVLPVGLVHSGCSRRRCHDAPPATTCSWRARRRALAAPLPEAAGRAAAGAAQSAETMKNGVRGALALALGLTAACVLVSTAQAALPMEPHTVKPGRHPAQVNARALPIHGGEPSPEGLGYAPV